MIRYAVAIAIALGLSTSSLHAQTTELKVTTVSADVHKFPSIASPVIGKAPRGTSLEMTRAVGDWAKISWPAGPDGVGYVRLSVGSIASRSTPNSTQVAESTSSRPTTAAASQTTSVVPTSQVPVTRTSAPTRVALIDPPTHFVGLGGRMGAQMGSSTFGFGAGARAWSRGPLGAQLEVSRYAFTNSLVPGRVTAMQFAPSVLFAFPDRVSSYIWMRPYVGAGANLYRSTLSGITPGVTMSDSAFGFQAFGGGELTFASAPRFALSADVGYHSSKTPFAGFELGGAVFSVSGHWYVK